MSLKNNILCVALFLLVARASSHHSGKEQTTKPPIRQVYGEFYIYKSSWYIDCNGNVHTKDKIEIFIQDCPQISMIL